MLQPNLISIYVGDLFLISQHIFCWYVCGETQIQIRFVFTFAIFYYFFFLLQKPMQFDFLHYFEIRFFSFVFRLQTMRNEKLRIQIRKNCCTRREYSVFFLFRWFAAVTGIFGFISVDICLVAFFFLSLDVWKFK